MLEMMMINVCMREKQLYYFALLKTLLVTTQQNKPKTKIKQLILISTQHNINAPRIHLRFKHSLK